MLLGRNTETATLQEPTSSVAVHSMSDGLSGRKGFNNKRLLTLIGNYGVDFATGGNSRGQFVHNHILFNVATFDRKGRATMGPRIDPRTVFCSDLGF
jgi:hypothetical protein